METYWFDAVHQFPRPSSSRLRTEGLPRAGDIPNRGSRFSASVLAGYYLTDLLEELYCGLSRPRDESLLFRQKEPKPCLPVRGPSEPAQKQALRDAAAPNATNPIGIIIFSRLTLFGEDLGSGMSIECY